MGGGNGDAPAPVTGSISTTKHHRLRLFPPSPLQVDPTAGSKNRPAMKGLREHCMRIQHRRHLQALADDARKLAEEKAAGVSEW